VGSLTYRFSSIRDNIYWEDPTLKNQMKKVDLSHRSEKTKNKQREKEKKMCTFHV
jgi:hypothetical protein